MKFIPMGQGGYGDRHGPEPGWIGLDLSQSKLPPAHGPARIAVAPG